VAVPGRPGGEAAIGAVLKNSDNLLVEAISESIGQVDDHHIAEFRALVEGLTMAKRHGVDKIPVFTDSELLVRSVLDEVNLRSPELQELRSQARELYGSFTDRNSLYKRVSMTQPLDCGVRQAPVSTIPPPR
jgi:ribonuclease HI